jgi:outer membrane biosynthesis protein TonB
VENVRLVQMQSRLQEVRVQTNGLREKMRLEKEQEEAERQEKKRQEKERREKERQKKERQEKERQEKESQEKDEQSKAASQVQGKPGETKVQNTRTGDALFPPTFSARPKCRYIPTSYNSAERAEIRQQGLYRIPNQGEIWLEGNVIYYRRPI